MPTEPSREARRRLQITGRATLTVSIPSEWAKEMGLKPGDEVGLALQPDRTILLRPRPAGPGGPLPPAHLSLPEAAGAEALFRDLVAHYLVGYDTVKVAFPKGVPLETLRWLKEQVREKLVGMEVVEETGQSVTFQNLVSPDELPLDRALHRMAVIVRSMHRDALQALRAGDANLAREVVQRDHEVDKFCLLVIRQLKEALRNVDFMRKAGISSSIDCMGYRVIARSIERIGDHAENIARHLPALAGHRSPVQEEAAGLGDGCLRVFEETLDALASRDPAAANRTISRAKAHQREASALEEKLRRSRLPAQAQTALAAILESLRRTAGISADIGEIVLNMSVSAPGAAPGG